MFEIGFSAAGTIELSGRLGAAQAPRSREFLDRVSTGPCVLVNVNAHIIDIFRYSGFDKLFEIEAQQS